MIYHRTDDFLFSYNDIGAKMLQWKKRKDKKMAIFYNRATLTFNGQSLNSNQVSGEITESLTITKNAISGSYSIGDNIAYAISISNTAAKMLQPCNISAVFPETFSKNIT